MPEAVPYCGAAPEPSELLTRWNLDPLVLIVLALAAAWLVTPQAGRLPLRRSLLTAALAALALSFISPLCALSSALFSARVVHHGLLIAVAAPLVAFALPLSDRRAVGLWSAGLIHAVILWAWHAPQAYAAALSNDAIYWTMQLSLFAPAVLFWSAVRRAPPLAAAAALLAFMMQMGLLGAALTFAGQALYTPHFASTEPWGLSALGDQQLGGLIMWAPMSAIYLLAALALVFRSLDRDAAQGAPA